MKINNWDVEFAEYITVEENQHIKLHIVGGSVINFYIEGELANLVYDSGLTIRPEKPSIYHTIWDGEKWALDKKTQLRAESLEKITIIESSITPRRIREAVLGIDGGWLNEQEAAIKELRATEQIKG